MKPSSEEQEISIHLKTLIRGLTQGNWEEACAGYKALYKVGAPAIPRIREAILQSSWSHIRRANEIRYVSGLVSLLRDIDETEAERVASELDSNQCDVTVKHVVTSILKFTRADYVTYDIRGIQIFEHRELFRQKVRPKLESWLRNVTDEDLKEIERIYVIPHDERNNLGSYMPILFTITLLWINPFSRHNPLSWTVLMNVEYTLYHEIGHHIHRHSFGQVPQQEQEADDYASRLLRIRHPILGKIGRATNRLLLRFGLTQK